MKHVILKPTSKSKQESVTENSQQVTYEEKQKLACKQNGEKAFYKQPWFWFFVTIIVMCLTRPIKIIICGNGNGNDSANNSGNNNPFNNPF